MGFRGISLHRWRRDGDDDGDLMPFCSAMADDEDQYKEFLSWAADQGITDVAEDDEAGPARPMSTCLGFALEIAIFPDAGG